MNRKLKFRVWATEAKQWIKVTNYCIWKNGIYPFGISPETVIIQQYTGLKDSKGDEIYEGDILKHKEELVKVIFDEGSYWFMYDENNGFTYDWFVRSQGNSFRYKVIGNIFQNPELLNE